MVHGMGQLNKRPSLSFPDYMMLLFSDSAKERAYGKRAWLENLVEADEGIKDNLEPDPKIPHSQSIQR